MLEEGVCNHRHERMTVEALPRPTFEVIETEFLFELLVGLLANPSCLDGRRQGALKRTHPPPCLVPQLVQKRLQPASQFVSPIRYRANHGRPLQKPTTHESLKN